ncbi:uncharacterized protein EAF01_007563 [Botrytis porri]|uniref:Uncharacterized protein n=1 Tax=Botrytis porri TaxID=87229 RepID=A0A4Z1KVZ4_9HELO|nr:uncharacterized protein EAF01_007563 [Botrytis porri]KAF7900261.1 hypothetical protein EAF01_007563 [Botrytis porri]TGO88576.1 hypothetical protein BPOR_0154g00160 [Botrytis porri]
MRRTTRKALVHLTLFTSALFLIIYLNRSSSNTSFPWTRIRYPYTSRQPALPAPHGLCPGLSTTTKPALIVSHVSADGDPAWLSPLRSKYHICIYNVDSSPLLQSSQKILQVPANRAHEAMPYLTFLIDNYEHIPAAGAVFIHGNRFQWHNDHPTYDNLDLLTHLNIETALAEDGYHNLKCDWSLSTCGEKAVAQGSLETSMQASLQPWDKRAVSDAAMPKASRVLFGEGKQLSRTDVVRSQCCAQFVVSRKSIWKHEREEYVALRQWLLDPKGAPRDDKVAGRILSYLWHVLFLEQEGGEQGMLDLERLNRQACPSAQKCYCRLYGKCDLDCRTMGTCRGQYTLPRNLRLPEDYGKQFEHVDDHSDSL